MKPIVKVEGKTGTILLIGQFDFNVHKDFRAASQELLENAEVSNIDVNFEQVPYLDSSALGMLAVERARWRSRQGTGADQLQGYRASGAGNCLLYQAVHHSLTADRGSRR